MDFYPSVYDKAACVFFSLAGGHIFGNGNKRTAVLALDQFLLANATYLLLSNEEMRAIAERTATYRTRNENAKDVIAVLSETVEANSVAFRLTRLKNPRFYREIHAVKNLIRGSRLNQPGARPRQAIRQQG